MSEYVVFLLKFTMLLVPEEMPDEKDSASASKHPSPVKKGGKIKLVAYGEEMLEKEVRPSGIAGQLYLPKDWVGCRVKIIRLD